MPDLERPILTKSQLVLADTIWDSCAFKVGAFRLKFHETNPDAPLSPYYVSMREKDVRAGTYPQLRWAIANALYVDTLGILAADRTSYVIGIPKAGKPLALEFSRLSGLVQLTMVKEETEAGRRITDVIREDFEPGKGVLGLDDLITRGNTKLEFISGVRANRLELAHLAVALDREQGGIEELRAAGVSVTASLRSSQLLEYYLAVRNIDLATFDRITAYMRQSVKLGH